MTLRGLRRRKVSNICAALALLVAPCLNAAVIVTPTVSGYIRGSDTGSAGSFALTTMLLGDTGSTGGSSRFINELMRFNLSAIVIPQGMTITSVSLTLTAIATDATSQNRSVDFQLYQDLRPFTTGASWNTYTSSISWQTKGGTGSLDRSSTLLSSININPSVVTIGQTFTLDSSTAFTSLVTSLAGTANTLDLWYGLSTSDNDGNRHVMNLASGLNATAALRPTLSISYAVPEPGTVYLGLAGGGILLLLRRRGLRRF